MDRIIKNYSYSALYHLFSIIIPLITTPYLSRVLGAGGIGSYAYEFSVASYFVLVIMLGLKNYGNKVIAGARDNKEELASEFSNIYTMEIVMLFLSTLLYAVYCIGFAKDRKIAFIMFFLLVASGIDITWFFSGLEEFRITVSRDFIVRIITTVLIFTLVKSANDVWKYALITSVGTLISQILLWPMLLKFIHPAKPDLHEVVKHIKPNVVMFVPVVAVNVYKTMDKVMLGAFSGEKEVGFYYSSEKIINVPMVFITSLNSVMLPRMSYLYKTQKDRVNTSKVILTSLGFSITFTAFLGTVILCVSDKFVPLFYGAGFDKCITLFWILIPNCVLIAYTNVVCYQYLIPNGYQTIYVGARVIGAFVNLILNACLIPFIQSYGAAIGTLLTEITVCMVQIFAIKEKLPLGKMNGILAANLMISMLILLLSQGYKIGEGWPGIVIKAIICGGLYAICVISILLMRRLRIRNEN